MTIRQLSLPRRGAVAALLAAALVALSPDLARAPEFSPYDGHIPFNCELQQAGTGTEFPHPEADPFCVEYDKTQQNVTDFGLTEFLSKEPARVAAASDKCFYFQRDHWTGTVVQGNEPEVWHWDGDYWFDKATGNGATSVRNYRVGGEPQSAAPYAPPEYQPYFDEKGGGGVLITNQFESDPRCAERVDSKRERLKIYYHRVPGGKVWRKRVTPVRLRTLRQRMIEEILGPPHRRAQHTDRYDVEGGGELRVGWRGSALDRRVAALLTTAAKYSHRGVGPGDRGRGARKALHARFLFHMLGDRVFEAPRRVRGRLLAGIDGGKVEWLAIADPRRIVTDRGLRRVLRNLLAPPG